VQGQIPDALQQLGHRFENNAVSFNISAAAIEETNTIKSPKETRGNALDQLDN
jgi:hypothetical protein